MEKKNCPFRDKPCNEEKCMAWTVYILDGFSGKAVQTPEGRCKLLPGV